MKSIELNKIMKMLSFPSYTKKGRLAYSVIEHESGAKLLKGFYLDSSINEDCFFLQYFVQSLFDPFPHLNFSLGNRLGGHLNPSEIDKINNMINSFKDFERLTCFSDYIPFLNAHPYYGSDVSRLKCYAFHYYLQSDFENSRIYFNKILDFETHPNSDWFEDDINIATEFVGFLDSYSYDKGQERLLQWQKETIRSLKLNI